MCLIDILKERFDRVESTKSEEVNQKSSTEHNGLSTKTIIIANNFYVVTPSDMQYTITLHYEHKGIGHWETTVLAVKDLEAQKQV